LLSGLRAKTHVFISTGMAILLLQLVRRGAEADIYVTAWQGRKAVAKVRAPKQYRHNALDIAVRKQRTVHEACLLSNAKIAGVSTPFVYFVDPKRTEIVMEFVEGKQAKDILNAQLCCQIGHYTALLHAANIIHGDLTTSNFVTDGNRLVLLDFGLAYYSERTEDMAVDVRLIKEVFTSAHVRVKGAFPAFVMGYERVAGKKKAARILANVKEIEQRGRYARVE
jgi:TP53 regulating kinase and related kinases